MGTGVNIKLTRALEILAGTPEHAKYWRKEDSGIERPSQTDGRYHWPARSGLIFYVFVQWCPLEIISSQQILIEF